jgi:hypothetical protein
MYMDKNGIINFNKNDLSYKTIALLLIAACRQDETAFERLAACLSMYQIEYVCNGKQQPVNGVALKDEDSLIAQVGNLFNIQIEEGADNTKQTVWIKGFESEEEYNRLKEEKGGYYVSPTIIREIPVSIITDYGFDVF